MLRMKNQKLNPVLKYSSLRVRIQKNAKTDSSVGQLPSRQHPPGREIAPYYAAA